MNHPKILAGRQGLPPTSNIPWSENAEVALRGTIAGYFIMFWAGVVIVAAALAYKLWPVAAIFVIYSILAYSFLREQRRRLYAMVLNKPRSTANLTQWTEHRWTGWNELQRQFICECGRLVDLNKATYFTETERFSKVCECGRGHFLMPPIRSPKLMRAR